MFRRHRTGGGGSVPSQFCGVNFTAGNFTDFSPVGRPGGVPGPQTLGIATASRGSDPQVTFCCPPRSPPLRGGRGTCCCSSFSLVLSVCSVCTWLWSCACAVSSLSISRSLAPTASSALFSRCCICGRRGGAIKAEGGCRRVLMCKYVFAFGGGSPSLVDVGGRGLPTRWVGLGWG